MSLVDLVRLVRGETEDDPRPNKALHPDTYRQLLQGYEHLDLMVQIATNGFRAEWSDQPPRAHSFPPNHRSAACHSEGVTTKILEGETAGTYLVVDEDLLKLWNVTVSPFGAVPKPEARSRHAIRLIHDLSFPIDDCINGYTIQSSLPHVQYQHFSALAERIEHLAAAHPGVRILILKGDVQGAFRHLRQHALDVHRMGGYLGQLQAGVIDMSAPFGWTGSPAFYSVFGRAISTVVGRESPTSMWPGHPDSTPFFAYEWVDDHVMVEPDLGERCAVAEDTLRLAMLAVLGPTAINESKFTTWSTTARVLGLDWDSEAKTVSMPPDKVSKAFTRVTKASAASRISKADLQRLLGSLRHVATCLRAARPFYQRLNVVCATAPRHGCTSISPWVADDLRWFGSILQSGGLFHVPTRLFGALPQPDIHVYMDASGNGLCILDPAWQRYVVLSFDDDELTDSAFDINVREQFAVALACLLFGPSWHKAHAPAWPHIRCWSDNQTTVSRTNRLSARHPLAQELNRSIGFAEATWRLRVSTGHLPGSWNFVADAGSPRPTTPPADLHDVLFQLQAASLASSSRRLYDRTWRQWCMWRRQRREPYQLPREPEDQSLQLVLFAIACWRGEPSSVVNSPSTVLSKCSHLSWHHQVRYGYPVHLSDGHRLALLGMRRLSAAPKRREPVTVAHFRKIRAGLNFNSPRDRVVWGAAVLGYFFLMRRSEYLGIHGSASWFAIRRGDVAVTDINGHPTDSKNKCSHVTVSFRGSKTDQVGESTSRTLAVSSVSWLCPVRAARALLRENSELPSSAPLCWADGAILPASALDKVIKRAAEACGDVGSQFGTHSLRAGGATALYEAGCDDSTIKLHGRWSSDCFQRYIHADVGARDKLAQMMATTTVTTPTERRRKASPSRGEPQL